jgi:hypothetical protein
LAADEEDIPDGDWLCWACSGQGERMFHPVRPVSDATPNNPSAYLTQISRINQFPSITNNLDVINCQFIHYVDISAECDHLDYIS